MSGSRHPLPGSDEARHNEIPEHLEREKGRGDDPPAVVQPSGDAVTPDGEPYPYDDPSESDELATDQAEHQDRGQSLADAEAENR